MDNTYDNEIDIYMCEQFLFTNIDISAFRSYNSKKCLDTLFSLFKHNVYKYAMYFVVLYIFC